MADSVDVKGLRELRDSIEDAQRGLSDLEEPGVKAARVLEARAEQTAPRDKGTLARNHTTEVRAGDVTVLNATRYARPVHAVQPWLARTLDALTREVVDIYETYVDQLVDDIRGA